MTVSELQILLRDLGKFLRASDAARVASELEEIGRGLEPFKVYKLKAFADFLVKAEEFARTGQTSGKGGGSKKVKGDAGAVDAACARVLELFNKATDPLTTLDMIEEAMKALQAADPAKAKLDDLARQLGMSRTFRSKAEVVKAIRLAVVGRKGAWDRVDA